MKSSCDVVDIVFITARKFNIDNLPKLIIRFRVNTKKHLDWFKRSFLLIYTQKMQHWYFFFLHFFSFFQHFNLKMYIMYKLDNVCIYEFIINVLILQLFKQKTGHQNSCRSWIWCCWVVGVVLRVGWPALGGCSL